MNEIYDLDLKKHKQEIFNAFTDKWTKKITPVAEEGEQVEEHVKNRFEEVSRIIEEAKSRASRFPAKPSLVGVGTVFSTNRGQVYFVIPGRSGVATAEYEFPNRKVEITYISAQAAIAKEFLGKKAGEEINLPNVGIQEIYKIA